MKSKHLISLLLLCMTAEVAMSQSSVSSLTETTEFIPGDDQRRDYNGQLCALVKIQVLDEITDVEGNIMGEMINHGVEKWVYMAQGSRNMKIHLKNNLPITVKFRDYNISELKSNRVYVLVLNVPNSSASSGNTNVSGNYLQLKVTPANANVTIWGDNFRQQVYRPNDDGTIIVYLPYGRYYYRATANDYITEESSVFVSDEKTWKAITLNEMAMQTEDSKEANQTLDINKRVMENLNTSENISNSKVSYLNDHSYNSNIPSLSFYIQPSFQAGTMMGYGGNIGCYFSGFNIEAYVTMTSEKEEVSLISSDSYIDANLSGLLFGGKVGYGIQVAPAIQITPQVGVGALSVKGDDLSTTVTCATAGIRLEYAFTDNFGVSLTPEGVFAISKQEIFDLLKDASSKIKGWGTGGNVRLGLFVKF